MKIRKLKKILKRNNTLKVIILKDNTPASPTKGMYFMLNYVPEFEKLKCDKFGATIIDKITNTPTKSFRYNMVVEIY